MSQLTPELAPALLEMCRGGAGEAAEALSRALDGTFALTVGEATPLAAVEAAELDGPGLAMVFHVGGEGVAIVLSESSGLLQAWTQAPDATGSSKLATLAQELGMLLLPEAIPVGETKTSHTLNLNAALTRGGVGDDATQVALEAKVGERAGVLRLIWPLRAPQECFASAAEEASGPAKAKPTPRAPMPPMPTGRSGHAPDFSVLPGYSRSLLKIRVPVSVQLATKKESLQEVISLGQGSIIKFDKGCEQLLQLFVGDHAVAEGEAVKVGEKFGFRVTSMLLPPEHFVTVKRPKSA